MVGEQGCARLPLRAVPGPSAGGCGAGDGRDRPVTPGQPTAAQSEPLGRGRFQQARPPGRIGFKRSAARRDHRLGQYHVPRSEIRVEPAEDAIEVDPSRLAQAILNLGANAQDAMPRGGHLLIETTLVTIEDGRTARSADARPGKYVRLMIRDDGDGMSEETLSHLFDPFFSTKEMGRGEGLGLATVHGMVRQHDGFIEVESVLFRHEAVLEAAVVARPDDHWGETPCAFVTLREGASATERDIIDFCRDNMAHFKAPKTVVFGPLPKTSTGKIQKFKLRERVEKLDD